MDGGGSGSSSDDEDPEWKATIQSIAAATTFDLGANGSSSKSAPNAGNNNNDGDDDKPENSQKLKHYQLKAQKLLDDILERNLEIVRDHGVVPENDCGGTDDGVRLFKNSLVGIVFDHRVEIQGPRKKPRLLPRQESNDNTKKLRQKIKSVAVDGIDIVAAAKDAAEKSLARLEAKESRRKEKEKREEERVAELKRIRGERWLPSIAREMNGSNA